MPIGIRQKSAEQCAGVVVGTCIADVGFLGGPVEEVGAAVALVVDVVAEGFAGAEAEAEAEAEGEGALNIEAQVRRV